MLFERLIHALPESWRTTVLKYPTDVIVDYDELLGMVQSNAPEQPFLLVAESYSTPLAIRFAATRREHLIGVVLCAGFASSPLVGLKRFVARLLGPILFYLPLSDWALRRFLIGDGAESSLRDEARSAIASVRPAILAA
jgi:pimeloyl-ACP methyl ester carboxylesterase